MISGPSVYGIDCSYSSPAIINNTITNSGRGISYAYSSPTISNNTISRNSDYGICGQGATSKPAISNNTIIGSDVGICTSDSYPAISNNIIASNNTGVSGATGLTVKNNCVYGNSTNYSGMSAGSTDISVDPLLEDGRYAKVHIQPGSPCINAGDSSVVVAGSVDMDGQPRVQGSSVDIGADESDGTPWPAYQPAVFRVSPGGSDTNDGSSWAKAKKTVQAAIDAASTAGGGEIWVAAGVYAERITLKTYCYPYGGFAGNETSVNQRDFVVNKSIIDGSGSGNIVTSEVPARLSCTDGFTLRNGGYGIACTSSSPAILNNTITGSTTGISCTSSSPAVSNNTIVGNSDYGIYCFATAYSLPSSNAAISNNVISGNGSYGIYCSYSSPTISTNKISANGCGIYATASSSPAISNNTITGSRGYGIDCVSSSPVIANNTLTGNGYGIFCASASPVVGNNIIAFNATGINKGSGTPSLSKNCVYGNSINYSGLGAGSTDISVDPLLEDVKYSKVHIQPGSPCIDAGDGSLVVAGSLDVDGQPRVQGAGVDIGADESDGTLWPVNPPAVFYVSPSGSNTRDGSSWAKAKKTVQAGIDAASAAGGGEIWVAAGLYAERITLKTFCYLYGGFVGNETSISQRSFATSKSILDGSGGGDVVASSIAGAVACINGFTIRNSGSSYNGIFCSSSSPAISNNTIIGNGWGIYCYSSSNPAISNNTIGGNGSYGIYCSSSSPAISNDTISGNGSRCLLLFLKCRDCRQHYCLQQQFRCRPEQCDADTQEELRLWQCDELQWFERGCHGHIG